MRDLSIGLLFIYASVLTITVGYETNNAMEEAKDKSSALLSRRKRFLVYPDGSSFQLVFCTQTHGYLQIGDIVWFGNTAALAWELPTDPQIYHMFLKNKKDFPQRRQDVTKNIYYLDEHGKLLAKVPYKKRPIVNPAFAKRSVDNATVEIEKRRIDFIKQMHTEQQLQNKRYLTNMAPSAVDFHRVGRKNLYEKLETFIEALGWKGKQCVLRLLCESGKTSASQGSFFEEMLRATFTLPKGSAFDSDDHKIYDIAHNSVGDCSKLYQNCAQLPK